MQSLTKNAKITTQEHKPEKRDPPEQPQREVAQCCAKSARTVVGCHD
ncbi:MAG: hypothetical protein AAB426_14595 [Myxococcota bacterium]